MVSLGLHNGAHEGAQVESVFHNVCDEGTKQRRVAGRVGHAHVIHILDKANIHEVGPHRLEGKEISSTKIRNAINDGHIDLANQYLGYNFKLFGIVEKGNQVGTNIGFPTANVCVENSNKIIPKDGVYAVKVHCLKNCFLGMLNIGFKPTFSINHKSIEVHIFDFSKNIYNEKITIEFIKRIRKELNPTEINQIDGIKLIWPDKWIHIRKSNTEPIVRFYSEAKTIEESIELINKSKEIFSN